MLRKKIFLNTVVNSGGKFLSFALQIFIITYLIKTMGKDAYGVVVLALALIANTNLLETGFGLSVTKYVAEYRAKGDWKRLLQIVNTNLVVSTMFGVVFCTLLMVINELLLERIFTIPPELLTNTKTMIRVLIPLSIVEFWSVSIIRVAEGFQRYTLARLMELSKWFLRAVFVFAFVTNGYGLVGIGVAYLAAGLLNLSVVYFKVIAMDPNLRLSPALSNKESFKQLFGFSVWIFLTKVFAFLSYRIDIIVIGIFLPPANLTYYNVAFKVFEVLRYGLSLISSTLVPVASELNAIMDRKRLSLLFEKATRYSVLVMCPVFIVFYFHMEMIIQLWVGSGFETSVMLGRLFIVSLFTIALITSGTEMMVGVNRVKVLIKYNAFATAINLVLSLYLVQRIGVSGVVIGTVVGSFVILITYLPAMMKVFEVGLKGFFGNVVFKTTIALIFIIGCLYYIPNYTGSIIGLAGYTFIAFKLLIDKDDMKEILTVLNLKGRLLQ